MALAHTTRHRILDVAEHLFARHGYHATTLRQITGRAGVNLAAVNYHFGSKRGLIRAVLQRRLHPINQARIRRLQGLLAGERRPAVAELLAAFIDPVVAFQRRHGDTAGHLLTLVGRAFFEADETVRTLFLELVAEPLDLLRTGLARALPQLDQATINRRLHYALGAMAQTIALLGREPALAREPLVGDLLAFLAQGFTAPAPLPPPPPTPHP